MTDTKSVDVGRTVAQPKIWIYAVRFYNHQNAVTVYDVESDQHELVILYIFECV